MKTIVKRRKKQHIFCFIYCLFVFSFEANATECGVLQLQDNRSSGVSVTANKCQEAPYISLGSVFDLSTKGRLWLKSNPSQSANANFQVICQNRTNNTVQLEFSDILLPWLTQAKLKNCSGWVDNKLSCEGSMGEEKGIYCVLAFNKSSSNDQKEPIRTTSVKMRGIGLSNNSDKSPINSDIKKILESIKPELVLCKNLNQISGKSKISWSVDQNSKSPQIDIISAKEVEDPLYSECLKTVITSFSYPKFSEKVTFNSDF